MSAEIAMNEYRCTCGEVIMKQRVAEMLDAVAEHMIDCPEAVIEAHNSPHQPAQRRRPYPTKALYRGQGVQVLGYAGGGDFLVVQQGLTTLIHRRHLTFIK